MVKSSMGAVYSSVKWECGRVYFMLGYFGMDASRAQLSSGVRLSTAGIPLYISCSLEHM